MSELAGRGRRGADDLQRAARGARHGRPRARDARGPAHRRALAAPRPTRSPSCARRRARSRRRRHERARPRAPQVAGAEARRLADCGLPRPRARHRRRARAARSLVTAIIEPRFLNADSLRNLALNASIFAILAVGQTLVIITRNVDLSVGSVLGLSAFMAGDLLFAAPGPADPAGVRRSGCCSAPPAGCSTASSSRSGQVPALVVTLGTLYVVPRHRVPVDERPPGQRRDAARRVPQPRHRLDPRHPDPRR